MSRAPSESGGPTFSRGSSNADLGPDILRTVSVSRQPADGNDGGGGGGGGGGASSQNPPSSTQQSGRRSRGKQPTKGVGGGQSVHASSAGALLKAEGLELTYEVPRSSLGILKDSETHSIGLWPLSPGPEGSGSINMSRGGEGEAGSERHRIPATAAEIAHAEFRNRLKAKSHAVARSKFIVGRRTNNAAGGGGLDGGGGGSREQAEVEGLYRGMGRHSAADRQHKGGAHVIWPEPGASAANLKGTTGRGEEGHEHAGDRAKKAGGGGMDSHHSPVKKLISDARHEVEASEAATTLRDSPRLSKKGGFRVHVGPSSSRSSVHGRDTAELDIMMEMQKSDDARWVKSIKSSTRSKRVIQGEYATVENPKFFSAKDLIDPVSAMKEQRRKFNRDGTVRDRFRGKETEAQVRERIRSTSCPPLLDRPDISLLTYTNFSTSVQASGAPAPVDDDAKRSKIGFVDMNRNLSEARGILGNSSNLEQSFVVDEPRSLSGRLESDLARQRLGKGMSAYDHVLLQGRDKYFKPRETTEVVADKSVDTSQLRTATMIKTHALMLTKESTEMAEESVDKHAEEQMEILERLRMAGFKKIDMMKNRLAGLRRIKSGMVDLSENSRDLLDVAGKVQHQFHFVETFLANDAEEQVHLALGLPPLGVLCPGHPKAFESRTRRDRLRELAGLCSSLKVNFKSWSSKSTEKYEQTTAAVHPLEEELDRLQKEEEEERASNYRQGIKTVMNTERHVKTMRLKGQVEKLMKQYQESEALHQVEALSHELLHMFVEMKELAAVEDKMVEKAVLKQIELQKLEIEKRINDQHDDLRKKVSYLFRDNEESEADAAATAILNVLKPIVNSPENLEVRKINSISRVSKIPLILEAKWGGEILNTIGFYPSKAHWFLPASAPMDLVVYGAREVSNALNLPLTELFGEADKAEAKGPDLFSSLKHGATLVSPLKAVQKEESKEEAVHHDEEKSTPLKGAEPEEGDEKGGGKDAGAGDGGDAGEAGGGEGGGGGGDGEGGEGDGDHGDSQARGEHKGDSQGGSEPLPAPERKGSQSQAPAPAEGSHRGRRGRRKSIMSEDVSPDEEIDRIFKFVDVDGSNSITLDELLHVLGLMGVDAESPTVSKLTQVVGLYGSEGMGKEAFKDAMVKIQEEQQMEEEEEEAIDMSEFDQEQLMAVKTMMSKWLNAALTDAWQKWTSAVIASAETKEQIVQNYREVCERFKCPSNPTIFSDYLMTRNQSHFDMRGRGLSTIGLKALCCAMYSRAPDFDQIRKLQGGGEVTSYLIKYPEETFKVAMGAPDVFKLRKEQLCVLMSVLDLSDNDFRAQGCQDLVEVLVNCSDSLNELLLSNNGIGDGGAPYLVRLFEEMKVASRDDGSSSFVARQEHAEEWARTASGNSINNTAAMVVRPVNRHHFGDGLRLLDISRNKIGDVSMSLIVKAIANSNYKGTINVLRLSNNAMELQSGIALRELLEARGVALQTLEIDWNQIKDEGVSELFEGIAVNRSLSTLSMSWNGMGREDVCEKVGEALGTCHLTSLDISRCRIDSDGMSAMSEGLIESRHLQRLVMDGNNIQQMGLRKLHRALHARSEADSNLEEISVSVNDCSINMLDGKGFDRSSPAGAYSLDMEAVYDREAYIEMMRIALEGVGEFLAFPEPRYDETGEGEFEEYEIELPEELDEEEGGGIPPEEDWDVPEVGVIEFSFGIIKVVVVENEEKVHHTKMESLLHVLKSAQKSERDRVTSIRIFCEESETLTFDQVLEIFEVLKDGKDEESSKDGSSKKKRVIRKDRSAERVELVKQCFLRVAESEKAPELLDFLSYQERLAVAKHLGDVAVHFTKNNPTGHYVLDLSMKPQHDVCLRLVELQKHQRAAFEHLSSYYRGRAGGPRPVFERSWRDAKLDGEPFEWTNDWAVPNEGILEFVFVEITKPLTPDSYVTLPSGRSGPCGKEEHISPMFSPAASRAPVVDLGALEHNLDDLSHSHHHEAGSVQNEAVALQKIREWSNRNLFTCEQISQLLKRFHNDKSRVELMVTVFARTLDWHGFSNLILLLSIPAQNELKSILGVVNLFDETMAVGYYELDLSLEEQRFVCQELIHLAIDEPGDNFIESQYNGIDLAVPMQWAELLPDKGLIQLYYCRDQETIVHCQKHGNLKCSYPYNSGRVIPSDHRSDFIVWFWKDIFCSVVGQPPRSDWSKAYRLRRIKQKMSNVAETAAGVFDLLDADGGGELDRKELTMGLFRIGIWLHPKELSALFRVLDSDGGGEIDVEEFEEFWSNNGDVEPEDGDDFREKLLQLTRAAS